MLYFWPTVSLICKQAMNNKIKYIVAFHWKFQQDEIGSLFLSVFQSWLHLFFFRFTKACVCCQGTAEWKHEGWISHCNVTEIHSDWSVWLKPSNSSRVDIFLHDCDGSTCISNYGLHLLFGHLYKRIKESKLIVLNKVLL